MMTLSASASTVVGRSASRAIESIQGHKTKTASNPYYECHLKDTHEETISPQSVFEPDVEVIAR